MRRSSLKGLSRRAGNDPNGLTSNCRACRSAEGRTQYLRRTYGITPEEADEFSAGFLICPICLSRKPVHIDHDHKTGKVRGKLCFECNLPFGKLRDDPAAARRAAAYLKGDVWQPILEAPGVYRLPS